MDDAILSYTYYEKPKETPSQWASLFYGMLLRKRRLTFLSI